MPNTTPEELIALINVKKAENLSLIGENQDQIASRQFTITESTTIISNLLNTNAELDTQNLQFDEIITALTPPSDI